MSYLMTLVHKKTQDFKEFFFVFACISDDQCSADTKTSRDFLVQVPKTLHSEAHSDYIFDIPAISLGEILGSLGLGNNIDLSLGFMEKTSRFFHKQNRYQIGNERNNSTYHVTQDLIHFVFNTLSDFWRFL